jgi:hypothetical protein
LQQGQLVHRLSGLCATSLRDTNSVQLEECGTQDSQQWARLSLAGQQAEQLQSVQLSTCIQPEQPESDGAVLMLREGKGAARKQAWQWLFNATSGMVRNND